MECGNALGRLVLSRSTAAAPRRAAASALQPLHALAPVLVSWSCI